MRAFLTNQISDKQTTIFARKGKDRLHHHVMTPKSVQGCDLTWFKHGPFTFDWGEAERGEGAASELILIQIPSLLQFHYHLKKSQHYTLTTNKIRDIIWRARPRPQTIANQWHGRGQGKTCYKRTTLLLSNWCNKCLLHVCIVSEGGRDRDRNTDAERGKEGERWGKRENREMTEGMIERVKSKERKKEASSAIAWRAW